MARIRVIGADYCPHCLKVKKHLSKTGQPYEWVDSQTPEGQKERQALIQKYSHKTIPIILIDGEFIGGADDFFKAIAAQAKSKKIQPKL